MGAIFFTKKIIKKTELEPFLRRFEKKWNGSWLFVKIMPFIPLICVNLNELEFQFTFTKNMSQVHSRSWTWNLKKCEPKLTHEREWTEMNSVHVHFFPSLQLD